MAKSVAKSVAKIAEGVDPAVRALQPLTAQQVAAVYRLDIRTVLEACERFSASNGKRGLRHFKSGRVFRIRPANVEAWLDQLEREEAGQC